MDFRILGRLEVSDGARPVALRGRKQRALLAFLLLHAGEWVSSDVLVDALWGERAPRTARAALQNYVARLRRALGPGILTSRDGGYELAVTEEQIDLGRFERLAGEARAADGLERAEKLREALELWRGPPLADLAYEPFASHEAVSLEELHVTALEDLIDAELAIGAGAELVETLETLVAEQPFRERLPAQLMLALYRCGRQAEALEVYQQTRRTLLEELGIEPGTTLRELEQAILRQDESLEPPIPSSAQARPLEERRKLVTVLFADITYAETLDPELLRETSGRALKAIRAALERHSATIEQRASDEVMAVFGVPQAHEDDALRAARAALELQAEIDPAARQSIDVRVGIESGEVLAGVDEAGHGFVSGAVVTVAKRLVDVADPGEVLAGSAALRLFGYRVISEPKPDAPEASVILTVADGAQAPLPPREEPPLVGRTTELRALRAAFDDAVEARAARLFLLLGEAGIGKTRLASELTTQLAGRATIARGRCLSYGQALTYWPLIEALRPLGETAGPALEQLVAGGASSPQQLAWSVQQALEHAAQERPLLVLLEDLHWAESALLDLLDLVGVLSRNAPILLLGLARPELLEQHPDWSRPESSLLLEPLPHADSLSLVSQLRRPLEPAARERVLERAAGNPLFLEELSAFVAEGGGAGGELPPRIHALLQARLDLLPEAERVLLTTAALEGMVFHRAALEALLPEERHPGLPSDITALTRALVIRPADTEFAGDQAFQFRHQLIRDTAYGALPKSDRARLHERFADWLFQRAGTRIELEDISAYHLERAALAKRELGAGAPALEQRAAMALAAAAERARRRTDLRAAASFGRRALTLLAQDDPRVPELELELGLMLATLGHFDDAQRLLAHAEQHTTDPAVTTAIRLGRQDAQVHYAPEGMTAAIRRECAEAIPLFERRADHLWLARAWHALAEVEWMELQARASAQAYENAAAEAELAGDRSLQMRALGERLGCLSQTRITFAAALEEADRLAEQFPGEPAIDATRGLLRAFAALNDGRRDEARAVAPGALELFRRYGYPIWAAVNTAMFGLQQLFSGDIGEAERLVLAGIAELEQLHERLFRGLAEIYLAQVRIAQGRYADALRLAEQGEHDSGSDERRAAAIPGNSARARAYARLGDIERARAAAATAVAVANACDSLQHQGMAQYALAETLAAAGDFTAAIAAAEEAVRLWTALDRKPLRNLAAALAEQIERKTAPARVPTSAV